MSGEEMCPASIRKDGHEKKFHRRNGYRELFSDGEFPVAISISTYYFLIGKQEKYILFWKIGKH
jgi:hypothetical protein